MALWTRRLFEAAVSASPIHIRRPSMTLEPFLSSLVVTMGLRGAKKRALECPIFRSVSGLERLRQGTVDAGMI